MAYPPESAIPAWPLSEGELTGYEWFPFGMVKNVMDRDVLDIAILYEVEISPLSAVAGLTLRTYVHPIVRAFP